METATTPAMARMEKRLLAACAALVVLIWLTGIAMAAYELKSGRW